MAERRVSRRELTLAECSGVLERETGSSGPRRSARAKRLAREFLQGLAGLGLGEYVVGRRGHASRLVWGDSDPEQVARLARGENVDGLAPGHSAEWEEANDRLAEIASAVELLKRAVAEARSRVVMIERRLEEASVPLDVGGVILAQEPIQGSPGAEFVTELVYGSRMGGSRRLLVISGIEDDPTAFSQTPLIDCDEETMIKAVPRIPELLVRIEKAVRETEQVLVDTLPVPGAKKPTRSADREARGRTKSRARRGGKTGGRRR
jgi:hypothetical protein